MPNVAAAGPYTWDDFIELDEDDPRERINGELDGLEIPLARLFNPSE